MGQRRRLPLVRSWSEADVSSWSLRQRRARIGLSLGRAAGQVRHSRKECVPEAMLSGKSVAQRIFVRAWGDSPFAP